MHRIAYKLVYYFLGYVALRTFLFNFQNWRVNNVCGGVWFGINIS